MYSCISFTCALELDLSLGEPEDDGLRSWIDSTNDPLNLMLL